ncbi:uncharacterized protein LOC134224819 isoform X2 [Armigeres subalbatus]|uniref:uncharacterized protein LOC134224819 isoform X2 n=1 Tax=Armigeres subalbatus TaxID=124917 RepID=UPI002ED5F452
MVSIMDIDPKRQICDTRATLSQSAVSQKSIDLEIPVPLKSPTSTTSPASPPTSGAASGTLSPQTTSAVDTELAKRAMKLDLIESQGSSGTSAASGTSATSTATTTTHSSNTANSSGTTTTAIMMKHRKLKERTFSDELGSPKSPAAVIDVVDDRKALRDALYQGIFHRHRRTIFAVGSFLRMLKSRNSSYNTIRSSSEGEDDTR